MSTVATTDPVLTPRQSMGISLRGRLQDALPKIVLA
ncbi:ABC transporter permease, partial [Rhizobium sp. UPM1133]|nr:ABC transporter permease [Rhizobium ruizarguesonis]